jgi:hypothetical protein
MSFKKSLLIVVPLIIYFAAIAVIKVAKAESDKASAPIELWETLCNKPELKSITITATYNNGRVETNDYYCVK